MDRLFSTSRSITIHGPGLLLKHLNVSTLPSFSLDVSGLSLTDTGTTGPAVKTVRSPGRRKDPKLRL